ncbi:MAG TPA: hypothetical protein VFT67_07790 [Jatrophihabitantaceae bacterium]|nr:hypothetical protein [Jatrophihabitantaceae bacterium]
MKLLAHRGFWTDGPECNSLAALLAAGKRGYGVETDIRDQGGEIVVSHDMPAAAAMTLRDLLAAAGPLAHPLALNVKADGLAAATAALLAEYEVLNAFVFDMSIPDHLAWITAGVATLTRWSDIEPSPVLDEASAGIWLDSMHRDLWWDPAELEAVVQSGRLVAFVSPELHGREHLAVWNHIREHGWDRRDTVLLCTDFPDLAERFFA